ncbi:AAA family ATPase [Mesorhizobium helmanticense]|uniref:UDP-N-acetylglucosamine kinase n=1 Tax=Mesorhizobium helmanticense TaxID=1776423 RepID=A0A2T4IWP6_9HYPH|nr:AAA family ATPase [Mesorhizobium helmanticense]PTE10070.1 hypothetical protein C9427_13215 [Mesorhizobium helmanticense]
MATTTRANPPRLWMVAGPNGSGKSTFYDSTIIDDFGRSVWIINPDLLTERIVGSEGLPLEQANLEAVKRIMVWLRASLRAHQTVGVETVLSTPKYRKLVRAAKRLGFEFRLIYIVLKSPELNIERVRLRVARGGHSVPLDRVVSRFTRSLEQLPWFVEQADLAYVYDNSTAKPKLVAEKLKSGEIVLDPEAPEVILSAIRSIATT